MFTRISYVEDYMLFRKRDPVQQDTSDWLFSKRREQRMTLLSHHSRWVSEQIEVCNKVDKSYFKEFGELHFLQYQNQLFLRTLTFLDVY